MTILDSGKRRDYDTGAVRDIQEGKGRCDLLPLDVVSRLIASKGVQEDNVLQAINFYIRLGDIKYLYIALNYMALTYFKGQLSAVLEVSKHYEEGCLKYGDRNWEKGIDLHCYIDSAVRHYIKLLRGDVDESHERAVMWNLMCAVWTAEHKPELNDLPCVKSNDK